MTRKSPRTPKTSALSTCRERILTHFAVLGIPLSGAALDAALIEAGQQGVSHLEFLERLLGGQADARRERSIERRIREACFREVQALEAFDWEFNRQAIDRRQVEELATGEFIRRHDNLVLVGQSGVGKSFLAQAIGRRACALGYRVRYITSAALVQDLTSRLADKTLPRRVGYYARFDWLIIDEFGFERLERIEARQAASLLYKIIDARGQQRSTSVVTNVDFEHWGEYLEDPPLAMAFLDRLVDGAVILKIRGKSYRAHRAQQQVKNAGGKSK